MTVHANDTDLTSNSDADRSSPEQAADCQIEQPEGASTDATDAILTAVLRVFAARGRAIREERARREMLQPESVRADQENGGQNQKDGTDTAL